MFNLDVGRVGGARVHLVYIDESGDPFGWNNQSNFALAGIAIHEGQIQYLSEKMSAIQQEFFPAVRIPIIFHAEEIHGGHGRFRSITQDTREKLMQRVYNLIGSLRFPNTAVFATDIDDTYLTNKNLALDLVLEDLANRFNIYSMRLHKRDITSKGLFIIDQAHESRYRELILKFQTQGTSYSKYLGNVVDIPYFAGGRDTRMLQLADFCAYAVFRYYEQKDDSYLKLILPAIDRRGPAGPPEGLKHLTQLPCKCQACVWR